MKNRSEILAGRGQNLTLSSGNGHFIAQENGEFCTGQAKSQPISFKSDRLLGVGRLGVQCGFAIVSAIFLLVILAALGAFMLTFSTVQHTTATTDLEGSRAYQAARAGIDWTAFQVLDPSGATVVAPSDPVWPNFPPCPAGAFPGAAGFAGTNLAGFNVVTGCLSFDHVEGSMRVRVYQLTATATGGSGNYAVSRVVNATVSKCRNPDAPAPYEC